MRKRKQVSVVKPEGVERSAKRKRRWGAKRILLSVLILTAAAVIGYQIYLVALAPLRTEICYSYTVGDTISASGMVFRDEQIINIDRHDTVIYSVSDGSKVANGSTIASIYSRVEDSQNRLLADSLKEQVGTLQSVMIQSGSTSSYLETINGHISEDINTLSGIVSGNMLDGFEEVRNDLEYNMIAKDLAVGKDIDLQGRIAEIEAQIAELEAGISAAPTAITTPVAGYFVSNLDSFESDCSTDKLTTYTADQLLEMSARAKAGTKQTEKIGKVISGYQWSYAAVISATEAEKLTEGKKVTLSFPLTEAQDIPAEVTEVTETGDGRAIAYFTSNYMTEAIANLRGQDVNITANSYTGIRVSTSAVRAIDGVKGVYVKNGSVIQFKKIEVLYSNDVFTIVDASNTGSDYLKMYDEVVVEGRNLYDGKQV